MKFEPTAINRNILLHYFDSFIKSCILRYQRVDFTMLNLYQAPFYMESCLNWSSMDERTASIIEKYETLFIEDSLINQQFFQQLYQQINVDLSFNVKDQKTNLYFFSYGTHHFVLQDQEGFRELFILLPFCSSSMENHKAQEDFKGILNVFYSLTHTY